MGGREGKGGRRGGRGREGKEVGKGWKRRTD